MTMLSDLDRDEWWDVYRVFMPNATRDDFDRDWAEFQAMKAEHQRKMRLQ